MLALLPVAGPARVVEIEIDSRETVLDGNPFGLAGPYERITGTIRFAVDPSNSANQIVTDIDMAPRDSNGNVTFSSEFFMLKPIDPGRGNGALLYEVSNRGRKGMLGFFNLAAGSLDPMDRRHFGDGFLLSEGYTLLWLGWQFDPPHLPGLLRLTTSIARGQDAPIRGLVRSDFVVRDRELSHSLADRNHVPYLVADRDAPENVLTVRDSAIGERETIPRDRWSFGRWRTASWYPIEARFIWKEVSSRGWTLPHIVPPSHPSRPNSMKSYTCTKSSPRRTRTDSFHASDRSTKGRQRLESMRARSIAESPSESRRADDSCVLFFITDSMRTSQAGSPLTGSCRMLPEAGAAASTTVSRSPRATRILI